MSQMGDASSSNSGAIRDAGGSFARKEAFHETEYFLKKVSKCSECFVCFDSFKIDMGSSYLMNTMLSLWLFEERRTFSTLTKTKTTLRRTSHLTDAG